ncbi:hypothetical protein C5167_006553 [Papaver somniferum]|uniref:Uncharacterized protein n=1 Tax=Papaver somniferum TaxID=3469 RepID=A0A4Y7JHL6_PAPSO|nr:hypothetical protein C5167_006553 [Papaver somniferum]
MNNGYCGVLYLVDSAVNGAMDYGASEVQWLGLQLRIEIVLCEVRKEAIAGDIQEWEIENLGLKFKIVASFVQSWFIGETVVSFKIYILWAFKWDSCLTQNPNCERGNTYFESDKGSNSVGSLTMKIDKEQKILSIRDHGIRMTMEDLIKDFKTGTSAFVEKMQTIGDFNLIGQFGDEWNEPLGRRTEIRLHLRWGVLEEDKFKEVDVEVPADEDDSEAESSERSFIEGKEVEEDGNLPGCFLRAQAIGLMPIIDQMQISVVGGLVLIRYLYKAFKLIVADPDTNPSLH